MYTIRVGEGGYIDRNVAKRVSSELFSRVSREFSIKDLF